MRYKEGDIIVIKGDPTQLYLVWSDFSVYLRDPIKIEDKGVAVVKFPQIRDHTDYQYVLPRRCIRLATKAEITLYG